MSSGVHRGCDRGSLGSVGEARGSTRGGSCGGRARGRSSSTTSHEVARTSTCGPARGLGAGTPPEQQVFLTTGTTDASSATRSPTNAGGGGGSGGRQRLYLVEKKGIKYFKPQLRSGATILSIFKSSMHKDAFSWKLVPEEKKLEYFEEFKKVFYWEHVEEESIKELWRKKAAIRYKNLIINFKADYLAQGNKPAYIPDSDWEGWIAYWERDDANEESRKAKMCRLSEPEGPGTDFSTHFGESRSTHEYAELLAKEKNMSDEQVNWEVFLRINYKNGDYTSAWAKQIAERVYQVAYEMRELQDSTEEQEIDMNAIYIEVAKENSSNEKMLGLGDQASRYTSCGSCSSGGSVVSSGIDTETMTQQLSTLQTKLQEAREERKQLEERMEEQVQRQAVELARMKEQLDMIMQRLLS